MMGTCKLSIFLPLLTTLLTPPSAAAFQCSQTPSLFTAKPRILAFQRDSLNNKHFCGRSSKIMTSQQTEIPAVESGNDNHHRHHSSATTSGDSRSDAQAEAARLRAEAKRMRLEAENMDSALTMRKIETLERKLSNDSWLEKNPQEADSLRRQIESLNNRLSNQAKKAVAPKVSEMKYQSTKTSTVQEDGHVTSKLSSEEKQNNIPSFSRSETEDQIQKRLEQNPLAGYDEADLALYNPVVNSIEKKMPNATLDEKLEAFRAAPELQEHFQEKIRQMLVGPIEDMQKLENLKQQYLRSSSSVEKKQIKREMEQLEKAMEDDSPFMYSDSVVLNDLPPLTEEEIQQRSEAVGELNPILQALYKKRCGVNETGDLRLAIELEHYDAQIQLLDQVRYVSPVTDEMRHEIRIAYLSLPNSVRNHFAQKLGLENGGDVGDVIKALTKGEKEKWMTLQDVAKIAGKSADGSDSMVTSSVDLSEYADIEFVDRSRYIQEFLPSLARLEIIHPPMEDIEMLLKEVLDRRVFMVTTKPERVIGGYYISGQNQYSDSETTNNEKMISALQERLKKSSVKDKIDLFYLQDPSPPTNEEYEAGETDRPVLFVTAKNREQLYNPSTRLTKTLVSATGLFSVLLFSFATTEMQPAFRDLVEAAATGDPSLDLSAVFNSATQTGAAILGVQLVHEAAHRFIAWRDKFDIGFPTYIPSIQIGLQGAITPFKSPPPSNKSLFDFSMAGPLAGLLVSLGLLVAGLSATSAMDFAEVNQLPALPIFLLKSSSLCGGLVEYFIGKGTLMSASADSVLPLHPFAVAGLVGILSNALALLPLGNTDGGRIAMTMFGRRGAYLVRTFTTLLLCAAGIFGLDEPRIFLTYVLFVMLWQRDLEAPVLNEADDLDFFRGLVGIGGSILVALALLPMV